VYWPLMTLNGLLIPSHLGLNFPSG
jgi:hypothetical protein